MIYERKQKNDDKLIMKARIHISVKSNLIDEDGLGNNKVVLEINNINLKKQIKFIILKQFLFIWMRNMKKHIGQKYINS
jgi:hypothetical protein